MIFQVQGDKGMGMGMVHLTKVKGMEHSLNNQGAYNRSVFLKETRRHTIWSRRFGRVHLIKGIINYLTGELLR